MPKGPPPLCGLRSGPPRLASQVAPVGATSPGTVGVAGVAGEADEIGSNWVGKQEGCDARAWRKGLHAEIASSAASVRRAAPSPYGRVRPLPLRDTCVKEGGACSLPQVAVKPARARLASVQGSSSSIGRSGASLSVSEEVTSDSCAISSTSCCSCSCACAVHSATCLVKRLTLLASAFRAFFKCSSRKEACVTSSVNWSNFRARFSSLSCKLRRSARAGRGGGSGTASGVAAPPRWLCFARSARNRGLWWPTQDRPPELPAKRPEGRSPCKLGEPRLDHQAQLVPSGVQPQCEQAHRTGSQRGGLLSPGRRNIRNEQGTQKVRISSQIVSKCLKASQNVSKFLKTSFFRVKRCTSDTFGLRRSSGKFLLPSPNRLRSNGVRTGRSAPGRSRWSASRRGRRLGLGLWWPLPRLLGVRDRNDILLNDRMLRNPRRKPSQRIGDRRSAPL